MKLIVFVLDYNEEKTIGEVLDLIPEKIDGIDVIEKMVVSDGSIDETVKIAKSRGAHVIDGKKNKKIAFRFQQAADELLKLGADIAVHIDADMQFNPEDIPYLVEPILKDGYDFVASDRFTDPETGKKRKPKNMPSNKYYANLLGAWIVGKLTGYKFNDVTCGFRAYTRDTLYAININSKYTYTQESFQVLALKKMNMHSVPIEVKYYPGRKSRMVTNFITFLSGSSINILRAFRDHDPLKFFGLFGLIFVIIGIILATFVGVHYLQTGAITPYKTVGFIAIYSASMGFFIWGLGAVADMFDRSSNNQEKIIERLKRLQYPPIN